jgi:hypothetical protein
VRRDVFRGNICLTDYANCSLDRTLRDDAKPLPVQVDISQLLGMPEHASTPGMEVLLPDCYSI